MKLVTLLLCVNLIQAFQANDLGTKSLSHMSNRLRKGNNRFSRCLRFFQLSKTFNFNHCRDALMDAEIKIEQPIAYPMKTEQNEIRRFHSWTKYHSFDWK